MKYLFELVSDAVMFLSKKCCNTISTTSTPAPCSDKGHNIHRTNPNKSPIRTVQSAAASLAPLRLLDLPLLPKHFSCGDTATCFFLANASGQTALLYNRRKFSCSHLETVPRVDPRRKLGNSRPARKFSHIVATMSFDAGNSTF